MKSGLFLDVVIRERPAILQLLSGEDQSLLIRGDALLVLDLGLDVVDGVGGLDVKRDCFACESLHEDLHTTSQSQDQMKSGLFLDVVIRERPAILQLLSGEDQSLLIRG